MDVSGTFSVKLVASDRPVWSGEAKYVIMPAEKGAMGILVNHEPILTVVTKGKLHMEDESGKSHDFVVNDGFAAFHDNELTIAVEECTTKDEAAAFGIDLQAHLEDMAATVDGTDGASGAGAAAAEDGTATA